MAVSTIPRRFHGGPAPRLTLQSQEGKSDAGFVPAGGREAQHPFLDRPAAVELGHVRVEEALVVEGVVVAVGVERVVARDVGLGGDHPGAGVQGLPREPGHLVDRRARERPADLLAALRLREHLRPERFGPSPVVHDQVVHEQEARNAELAARDAAAIEGERRSGEGTVGDGDVLAAAVQVHDLVIPEDVVRYREGCAIEEYPQDAVVVLQVCVLGAGLGRDEFGILERRDTVAANRADGMARAGRPTAVVISESGRKNPRRRERRPSSCGAAGSREPRPGRRAFPHEPLCPEALPPGPPTR